MSVTLKWKYPCPTTVISSYSAIGESGTIYFATYDNFVYALNPDGTLKWKYPISGGTIISYFNSFLVGPCETVYFVTTSSTEYILCALNPDGTPKWSCGFEANFRFAVMPDGSTCALASTQIGNGWILYVLNPDGSVRWNKLIGNSVGIEPPIISPDGSTIYACLNDLYDDAGNQTYQSCLYAISSEDGSILWTYIIDNEWRLSTAGDDGTLYLGSLGNTWIFYAITPNGALKWKYDAGYKAFSKPILGKNDTIYTECLADSSIYAISNGQLLWQYSKADGIYDNPVVGADGTIYAIAIAFDANFNGVLCALNPDGTPKWEYLTSILFPHIIGIADGTIYLAGADETICAFLVTNDMPIVVQCQSFKLAKGPHGELILPV